MFFIASKALSFLLSPGNWFFAMLVWTWWAKEPKKQRRRLVFSIGFFYLFSNGVLQNEVRRLFEPPPMPVSEIPDTYDIGIVLSGMVYFEREHQTAHFTETSDRLKQAGDLYAQGKIKRFLISGGSGSLLYQDLKEADFLREFLIGLGVPAQNVIIESDSRNTYENASFTKTILDSLPHGKLLLITSATHMPRSFRCFKKVGLRCDIFPTNPASSRSSYGLNTWLLPNPHVLWKWKALFHEWFGIVTYKLNGYL